MNYNKLVEQLRKIGENEYIEFKENNDDIELLGKNISALSNSATLHEKEKAYIVYGVNDKTKEVVGTNINVQKDGFQAQLKSSLSQNVNFQIKETDIDGKKVVIFEIKKAIGLPVSWKGERYIRRGSSTVPLKNNVDFEQKLWYLLTNKKYEIDVCLEDKNETEILNYIEHTALFRYLNKIMPSNLDEIIKELLDRKIIIKQDDGMYSITNLGGLLFAKDIDNFPNLKKKVVRVIRYEGNDKMVTQSEQDGRLGYAVGFENLIRYIMHFYQSEIIEDGIRVNVNKFPEIAVREIVANALIHQDLSIVGSGPMIELFDNRIEVTNPGKPIVEIEKIINVAPKSRNEEIASLMRQMGICEERGSGWDKIEYSVEQDNLPSPIMEYFDDYTRVVLFEKKEFSKMSPEEKLLACYRHACLAYASRRYIDNTSLRERFGVPESSKASISRLINEAVNQGFIKPVNNTAPRYMKYAPFWAK